MLLRKYFCCSVTKSCLTVRKRTTWTAAHQVHLSFTISLCLLKLMSIEPVMLSYPSHPLLSPSPPALNPSQHQGLFK